MYTPRAVDVHTLVRSNHPKMLIGIKPMNSLNEQVYQSYESSLARIVLLCISELPISLGVGKIIGILRGGKSSFFIDRNLHKLSTYGVLPTFSKDYLESVIGVLIERGLVEIEMVSVYENLPVLRYTEEGKKYLLKPIDYLDLPFVEKLADKQIIELDGLERILFEDLRRVRSRIAGQKDLPAYTICHDTTLREMAKTKPNTPEALISIHGVGQRFVENYGEFFLEVINEYTL